jgi:methyl-accepting chemotaxis protein
MAKPMKTHKRRVYFVHPHFQGWFIAKVTALLFATSTVSSLAVYWLTEDFVATTRRAAHVGMLHWWGKFAPVLLGTNAAAFIVGAVVAGYVVLYASHKVVGPLVRVKHVLREIGDGQLHGPITLRAGDEIQETIDAILAMEARVSEKVKAVDAALANVELPTDAVASASLREAVEALPRRRD